MDAVRKETNKTNVNRVKLTLESNNVGNLINLSSSNLSECCHALMNHEETNSLREKIVDNFTDALKNLNDVAKIENDYLDLLSPIFEPADDSCNSNKRPSNGTIGSTNNGNKKLKRNGGLNLFDDTDDDNSNDDMIDKKDYRCVISDFSSGGGGDVGGISSDASAPLSSFLNSNQLHAHISPFKDLFSSPDVYQWIKYTQKKWGKPLSNLLFQENAFKFKLKYAWQYLMNIIRHVLFAKNGVPD